MQAPKRPPDESNDLQLVAAKKQKMDIVQVQGGGGQGANTQLAITREASPSAQLVIAVIA